MIAWKQKTTHFVSSQAQPFGQKAWAEGRRASSSISNDGKATPYLDPRAFPALPEAISMVTSPTNFSVKPYYSHDWWCMLSARAGIHPASRSVNLKGFTSFLDSVASLALSHSHTSWTLLGNDPRDLTMRPLLRHLIRVLRSISWKCIFLTVFCEIIFSESVLGRSYLGPNFFATKLRSGWRPPHLPSFRQLLCDV